MPNIKPISDLRNYSDVLHDVAVGAPVLDVYKRQVMERTGGCSKEDCMSQVR